MCSDVGAVFNGTQFPGAFALPGFGVPGARRESRRVGGDRRKGNRRQLVNLRPRRQGDHFALRARRGHAQNRCGRWNQARGRFDIGRCNSSISGSGCEASVGCNGRLLPVALVICRPGWARDGFRHKLVHQLVQAGLPAEMLGSSAQAVTRRPTAYAQLSRLLVGNKPMISLPLLRSANVARNGLPDHRRCLLSISSRNGREGICAKEKKSMAVQFRSSHGVPFGNGTFGRRPYGTCFLIDGSEPHAKARG